MSIAFLSYDCLMTHLDGYSPFCRPGWKPFKMMGHLCICVETKSLFLQFLRFTLPNKAGLLCFTDKGRHTWPQPQPEFIRLRESLIQRPSVSLAVCLCDVEFQSWETLGRVLFIHSRLNMSVSGRHDNGWWRSYIWTYPLCGKICARFFFNSIVLIQIVDTWTFLTFTLKNTRRP